MTIGYLLDTPLLSELAKRQPQRGVVEWVDACDESSLFISVLTLGELQKGISKLADSERREILQAWLTEDLVRRFHGRTLLVDSAVALDWGVLQGESERNGVPLPVTDSLIAATARVHDLTVVTRNERDMTRCGVSVRNPWQP
jgi:predicted nucleic acid-binding protein